MLQRILRAMVRFYQIALSPILPPVCRFQPTCSQYALDSLAEYGAIKGSWMSLGRICRCHPFHPGGYDPVPPKTLLKG